MKVYPVFALIEDRACLVVGGGAVGERKVRDLLEAGARVSVVSRELTPYLAELADQGAIRYLGKDFTPEHLEGMVLAVGATDDPEVNVRVSAAARERGIWVNIADAPDLCTFIVPAQIKRGPLTVAISTGGASPALARRLREELEELFGPEYGPYVDLLRMVREKILASRRGHPDNHALFQRLAAGPLKQAVAERDKEWVLQVLMDSVGTVLSRETVEELVNKAMDEQPLPLIVD
ncbi:MAG: bifunctional precorrin-2 dehydrogenase/sirohydrochlorin ferrochelatase [Deltaproteobacteria bacterium]|nr:bifunctional precorrin-2 dehydrogenase/sirohydrochlorin ferrochelatase [Deltaproteobacteria bacterium]